MPVRRYAGSVFRCSFSRSVSLANAQRPSALRPPTFDYELPMACYVGREARARVLARSSGGRRHRIYRALGNARSRLPSHRESAGTRARLSRLRAVGRATLKRHREREKSSVVSHREPQQHRGKFPQGARSPGPDYDRRSRTRRHLRHRSGVGWSPNGRSPELLSVFTATRE